MNTSAVNKWVRVFLKWASYLSVQRTSLLHDRRFFSSRQFSWMTLDELCSDGWFRKLLAELLNSHHRVNHSCCGRNFFSSPLSVNVVFHTQSKQHWTNLSDPFMQLCKLHHSDVFELSNGRISPRLAPLMGFFLFIWRLRSKAKQSEPDQHPAHTPWSAWSFSASRQRHKQKLFEVASHRVQQAEDWTQMWIFSHSEPNR